MMKKYYRNRYNSFLKALADRKVDVVKEAEIARQKEIEMKEKLAKKVLRQQPTSKIFLKPGE
jgi:DNA-binding LacI/PurR family transcriptional regulator